MYPKIDEYFVSIETKFINIISLNFIPENFLLDFSVVEMKHRCILLFQVLNN